MWGSGVVCFSVLPVCGSARGSPAWVLAGRVWPWRFSWVGCGVVSVGYSPGMAGVEVSRFSVVFPLVFGVGSKSIFLGFQSILVGGVRRFLVSFPPVLVVENKSILVRLVIVLCLVAHYFCASDFTSMGITFFRFMLCALRGEPRVFFALHGLRCKSECPVSRLCCAV